MWRTLSTPDGRRVVGDAIAAELEAQVAEAFKYDADDPSNFFTLGADGVKRATPLLAAVACLELSDVVFAVDSIPAVLGISTDPFVVYSSNVFAIAGLRALYALVAKAVDSMVYLKPAVCAVLAVLGTSC